MKHAAIENADQLPLLDSDEVVKGYRAGFAGRKIDVNASYSFIHGWKNGAVDGGHREKDHSQCALAHSYVEKGMESKGK